MYASDTVSKIAGALAKAQSEMASAKKDAINPHFKSKYADLAAIIDALRKPLSTNGICFTQIISEDGNTLITMLIHSESGEWLKSYFPILCQARTAQAIGSAITYAKRYALSAMCGLAADEDDDGNEAMKDGPKPPVTAPPQAKVDGRVLDGIREIELLLSEADNLGAMETAECDRLWERSKQLKTIEEVQKGIHYIRGKIVAYRAINTPLDRPELL